MTSHLQITTLEVARSVKLTSDPGFTTVHKGGRFIQSDLKIGTEVNASVNTLKCGLHPSAKTFTTLVAGERHNSFTILGKVRLVCFVLIQVKGESIIIETIDNFICEKYSSN